MNTVRTTVKLGFIGFGEAAFHIASGLHEEGLAGIVAFDVMAADPQMGPLVRERAAGAGVTLLPSLKELLAVAEVVLCATSAKYALAIARDAQPFLREGQLYADLNSASPQVKKEIAAVVGQTAALFVDTAVMALVPPHRHKVPMAVSGTGARRFAERLSPYGMDITYINDRAGSSSAIKMLRSIFVKGLTALLLEALTASRKAGVEAEIMASITQTLGEQPFEALANLLLTRTAVAAERRVAEMGEVISTLQEMGLDSSASQATRAKLQALAEMDLKTRFGPKPPAYYTQVLDAIIERFEKKEP
ncbi:MAG: DUF1932 domain-containing protein [Deltaproteobacteria bacterium]|nr:DUF1932 domain-containing protein [Deltaproteobacteria bacterium]